MNVPALDVVHAGFIRRFAAFIIDGFIIGIAFYAAALVLVVVVVLLAPGLGDASDETVGLAAVLGYLLLMAFYYVGAGCYYALQESSRHQATVGKRAMGIKVTDDDGNRLSRTHAFGRWFAAVLSYLSFYIGFLMAGFTERKRALHDMVADTLVVDRWAFTDTPERQQRGAGAAVILVLIVGFFIVVGVLGILAAIAIPAYQDYTVRARISQSIDSAAPVKLAVAEHHASHGECPVNGEGGILAAADYAGPSTQSIDAGTMGDSDLCGVQITRPEVGADTAGQRIWLEFDPGAGTWSCSGEVADRYLPARCRG